jgi:hypothetical protein
LEVFTAKGLVLAQPREGPCSKAATWSMSAFSCGVSATFLLLVEELVLVLCSRGAGTLG